MAVPEAGNALSMDRIARERKGFGYNSSSTVTPPIYMSDISRLTGGNSSGSGTSYPAVNTNNPEDQRPDGADPLKFSEFISYEQNLTRTPFYYIYSSSSSNDSCVQGIPIGPYWHTDGNNLYPDALDGSYTAYTTETGTTPVSSGYYQIFDSFYNSTNKYIQVGSNGAIIGGGNC